MVTKASSVVYFTTSSTDYNAYVRGPGNVHRKLTSGQRVPTRTPGFFTISVADRQLRAIDATLTDRGRVKRSTPPSVTKKAKELVVFAYQVI
jgi:hypothetical protein